MSDQKLPDTNPKHVAIIMDGNGRWAKNKKLPRTYGHKKGVDTVRTILQESVKQNIKFLSLYAFSTENWKRNPKEVQFLMDLFFEKLTSEVAELNKNNVTIKIIGDKSKLTTKLKEKINHVEKTTQNNSAITLNLMINYGSRHEIIEAIKSLSTKMTKEEINNLSETQYSEFLYTTSMPDPDILIRPGKEYRLSNYLLWQSAYTELFFTDTLWPDFNETEYIDILNQFKERQRRYGS